MSHQVCHCSWSKTTTTHQGKMGCTPKSVNYSPSGQTSLSGFDVDTQIKETETSSPDTSLQVCHCDWSKETTYQDLRTHQGKMGCTPKGLGIPEKRTFNINPSLLGNLGLNGASLDVSSPVSADLNIQSEKRTFQNLKFHPGETGGGQERDKLFPNTFRFIDDVITDRGPPSSSTPTDAAATKVKQEHKSLSETPHHSDPVTPKFHMVRRTLDFSDQQVEQNPMRRALHYVTEEEEPRSFAETLQRSNNMVGNVEEDEQVTSDDEYQQERHNRIIADLQLKLHMLKKKKSKVKSSLKSFKCHLYREWLEINSVFSDAMKVLEEARVKALQPLEDRKAKAKKEAQDLTQQLQEEINKLTKAINASDTDFQVSSSLMSATFDTSCSFGTLRLTTSTMMEEIEEKLKKLSSLEIKRFRRFEVDVKLDVNTAHRQLLLSADGKEVSDGGESLKVRDSAQRFDLHASILGGNSLASGKCYWEVEAGGKTGWDLGVARGDANRRGKLSFNPDEGFWVVVHYSGEKYAAMAEPPVGLTLGGKPERVGVFVDHDEGLVSFYDVNAKSHIHSFTGCSFGDEIFPYFSPHLRENGRNAKPLIISAVRR